MTDPLLWPARAFIYAHFAATAGAPSAADLARHFGLTVAQTETLLLTLHDHHALFLEPGTTPLRVRMANPFSAIATAFQTTVAGTTYFANCAWDTFGIAAALHASEAEIRSVCAASGVAVRLRLAGGALEPTDTVVHFLVPFAIWYDDLVHT
jgi:hypothetical protein